MYHVLTSPVYQLVLSVPMFSLMLSMYMHYTEAVVWVIFNLVPPEETWCVCYLTLQPPPPSFRVLSYLTQTPPTFTSYTCMHCLSVHSGLRKRSDICLSLSWVTLLHMISVSFILHYIHVNACLHVLCFLWWTPAYFRIFSIMRLC